MTLAQPGSKSFMGILGTQECVYGFLVIELGSTKNGVMRDYAFYGH